MAMVTVDGKTYETTHRRGFPAIRKINKNGRTARWIALRSETGIKVMRALGLEPAMAPGFLAKIGE